MSVERIELKTERLLLRPFRLEDVNDVFEFARDPEWARFLPSTVPQPYARKDAEAFVARSVLTDWETNPHWAIVLEGKVIGSIRLRIENSDQRGWLGYAIGKFHWGKGIMPEAVQVVVDWGFSERCLAKMYSWADACNTRSWRVMEKVGMTREGLLRSHTKGRDRRRDDVYYGLLRGEWKRQRSLTETGDK